MSNIYKSSLVLACISGDLDDVKSLVTRGANVNESNPSPIYAACVSENILVVEYLLKNGADIKRDPYEPLSVACSLGNRELALLLLQYGAQLDGGYDSPLGILMKRNDLEFLKFLAKKAPNLFTGAVGIFGFQYTITRGNWELAQFFLDNGADINGNSVHGYSVLFYLERLEDINFCLDHGLDIHKKGGELQNFILHEPRSLAMTRFFLEKGVDTNSVNTKGETPLHCSIETQSIDHVKLLLEFKANPKVVTLEGKTALHYANDIKNCFKSEDEFNEILGLLL